MNTIEKLELWRAHDARACVCVHVHLEKEESVCVCEEGQGRRKAQVRKVSGGWWRRREVFGRRHVLERGRHVEGVWV